MDLGFCVDLVCYTKFSIFELRLKPSLQLLNVEKEAAKVSSYPQEQVREVHLDLGVGTELPRT